MKLLVVAGIILYSFFVESARLEDVVSIEGENFVPSTLVPFGLIPSARIVGGVNAAEGQFPFQVSLRDGGRHLCGASIISKNFVVTAAHCVTTAQGKTSRMRGQASGKPASRLSIRAGSVLKNAGGVVVNVAKVLPHPNHRNFVNDIALLRLAIPLVFNERIKALPLENAELVSGSAVNVSGWGTLRNGGPSPLTLQFGTLVAMSNEDCRRQVGQTPQSILCLAHSNGKGVCQGDSGGPAVRNGRLVGVANYVLDSCGSTAPDGFAKVSYFFKWLKENSDV